MDEKRKFFLPRFRLGECVVTKSAKAYLGEHEIRPESLLKRHVCGDWGDVTDEDARLNEDTLASKEPGKLFSVYNIKGRAVFVYTNQEKGRTGVILSGEDKWR